MNTPCNVSPKLTPEAIRFTHTVQPGANWSHVLKRGTTLRLRDPQGGLNVSLLAFDADNLTERLNLPDTLKCQHTAKLTAGHCLYSDMGRILLSIPSDSLGWHDPLSGHSTRDTVEAAFGTRTYPEAHNGFYRNARDGFLKELGKRELGHNINFFMNVPVTPEGGLTFEDGVSAPGKYVEMRAERDVIALISNCPQLNNPCNAYNPTPIRVLIWNP